MSQTNKIDVIIPCYNAAATLARALESVLVQDYLGRIIIVDDASSDASVAIAQSYQARFPQHIVIEKLPQNSGVARARNWGMLVSQADVVAFLDADDAYERHVLGFASAVMQFRPEIPMLRLGLKPVDLDEKYAQHPNFSYGWRHVEMTVGGNMIFRRAFLLACGGFPQDQLFRRLGGEDVALGLAVLQVTQMGVAFDNVGLNDITVLHYCRPNMHAYRLLDTVLFAQSQNHITQADHDAAQNVTDNIVSRLQNLQTWLSVQPKGKIPLQVETAPQ
ncbi:MULTISPECIES: glycosyltransferase family 2 protein [Vitreoscilla]|uniref:Glycosyltransferase family 2 protein n=1 Tax=Vitreoscilla stercoraria TaxID=61 RepID=A0ABY4E9P6_VITST|nr:MULTISPECIES: glycosyltransferase family 2 protein [Vitreoscilla]AUZ06153.1 family 2 glycosyl transferase [Vitreoscilla sp. C1]UOO92483.1 glycosyltransferase family 2 protein [Vitreoscilla stercoraria]